MKNFVFVSVLLLSASAFAQPGMPAVNTDQATAAMNGAAAKTNAATADANTKAADAKTTGSDKLAKGKKALEAIQVNVNTASKEDLAKLPGIGTKKADAIIANRPYTSADGLKKVKGIGAATISKIKDKISF